MCKKIGVVGAGKMGSYHINVLRNMKEAELVGFYEEDLSKRKTVEENFGIKGFSDFEKFVDSCEAFVIATPTTTHFNISMGLLEKKKHLLIEKPITNSKELTLKLIEKAREKGCVLHVGHVERYNGAIMELSKIVDKPLLWEARRVGPNTGRIQDVGVVWDLMIHDIDICIRMNRSPVKNIEANFSYLPGSKFEDAASCSIIFENGCLANFVSSRVTQKKNRMLYISQLENHIVVDFTTQSIDVFSEAGVEIVASKDEVRYSQRSNSERLFIHKQNPLEIENRRFLKAISEKTSSYEENMMDLETVRIAEKIVEIGKR